MSADNKSAVLYVYEGNFGLPSIDPKSLQLLFYLRLHPDHNIKIQTPDRWLTPKVPALKYNSKLITDFEVIMETLTKLVEPVCDEKFDQETRERIKDFKYLNFRLMESPFLLNFWGYKSNSDYFSNLYSSSKYWMIREIFKMNLTNFHNIRVINILNNRAFPECIEHGNFSIDRYFDYISFIKGNKKYIFGNSPSTYDAHLCGYLVPLMTYNFPNNQLTKILKKYGTLVSYVNNYIATYCDDDFEYIRNDDVYDDNDDSTRGGCKQLICHIMIYVFIAFVAYFFYDYNK